jgi:hypothetical protein
MTQQLLGYLATPSAILNGATQMAARLTHRKAVGVIYRGCMARPRNQ